MARLLPFLKNDQALKILNTVTCNLPMLMSRDVEEVGADSVICFVVDRHIVHSVSL